MTVLTFANLLKQDTYTSSTTKYNTCGQMTF